LTADLRDIGLLFPLFIEPVRGTHEEPPRTALCPDPKPAATSLKQGRQTACFELQTRA